LGDAPGECGTLGHDPIVFRRFQGHVENHSASITRRPNPSRQTCFQLTALGTASEKEAIVASKLSPFGACMR
jgi:hypothetical protein